MGDVEHIALGQAVYEIGVEQFGKILLAFHIGEPVVVSRTDVEQSGFGKGNRHLVEHEKNDKFLHLAVERLIGTELFLNVIHALPTKMIAVTELPHTNTVHGLVVQYYNERKSFSSVKAKKMSKYKLWCFGGERYTTKNRKIVEQLGKMRFGIDIDFVFV